MQDDGDGEPRRRRRAAHRLEVEGSRAAARDGEGDEELGARLHGRTARVVREGLLRRARRARRARPTRSSSRAYKKLAKQHHPDANPGNKDAEERFKEISAAYDVLGDAEKRKEYDEVRRMVASGVGPGGFGGPAAAGSARQTFQFDVDFGAGGARRFSRSARRPVRRPRARRPAQRARGPQRGQDLETELHLSFDDAVTRRHAAPCGSAPTRRARRVTAPAPRRARRPRRARSATAAASIAVDQGPFSFSQVCPTCGGRGQVDPDPVPDVSRPRRRGARPRGEGAHPGRRRRRAAHPREGPRRGRRQRRSARRPLRDRARAARTRCSAAAATTSRCSVPVTFAEATLGADVKVPDARRAGDGAHPARHAERQGACASAARASRAATARAPATCSSPSTCRCRPSSNDEQREAVEALAQALDDDPRAGAVRASSTTGGAPMDLTRRALYVISVAAELAGVHPQTLRIYERKGLLAPARTSGRSRRYSDARHRAAAPHPGAHQRRRLAAPACSASSRSKRSCTPRAQRIGELEARARRAAARRWSERVAAAHRQYRRELVPLRTATVVLARDHDIEEVMTMALDPNRFTRKTQEALGAAQAAGRDAGQHRDRARAPAARAARPARGRRHRRARAHRCRPRRGARAASTRRSRKLPQRERRDGARRAARARGVPPARGRRQGARAARRRVPLDRAHAARDDRRARRRRRPAARASASRTTPCSTRCGRCAARTASRATTPKSSTRRSRSTAATSPRPRARARSTRSSAATRRSAGSSRCCRAARRTTRCSSASRASARPRSSKVSPAASSRATCPRACATSASSRSTSARWSRARSTAASSRSGSRRCSRRSPTPTARSSRSSTRCTRSSARVAPKARSTPAT